LEVYWHPINQFLPLTIEVFGCLNKHYNVFLHDYANAIWSLKGIENIHPWSLFFVKTFRSHYKRCKRLPFKWCGSRRLNYFSIATCSKHTSHHDGQSIASCCLLTHEYGRPSSRLWIWTDFPSYFEPTWHHVTSPFLFILFLCTFPSHLCFLIKLYMSLIGGCCHSYLAHWAYQLLGSFV
jgi:hypothetical protein